MTGAAACVTGIGCPGGVAVMAEGAVAIGIGAVATSQGAIGLGENLALVTGRSGSSVPGFTSSNDLTNHFLKHGSEFGYTSEADYLNGAQNFVATKGTKGVLVKVRTNGDVVIYNPTTNEFAVTRSDGTIKTYFKPDPAVHKLPTNMDYFNSQ